MCHGRRQADRNPRPHRFGKFEAALSGKIAEVRESLVERGLLEIYRFLPPPLLERFDPENVRDLDEFLDSIVNKQGAK